ncbi:HEAT repeat domain-containing protein [Chondromyces apiculatus]|uniref:Phycocyanin alpha phycocyanobilin lyase related protein n=1 Tax=Chondromyces apiculatus DSM 436 TaxID=1192034 RepID=A0A017T421_9BACT|nr:HEAT repeat domain-containing protein [Chondromyces apiculatus]EYF03993.1 phycocyanin alpha phycocyanobilin lyase related protein [Chondromyces apiculatus DSM 436]
MSATRPDTSLSTAERDRVAEVQRLEGTGAEGVPELLRTLDDPSWSVRRNVVAALARLGDVAIPTLFKELCENRASEAKIAACVDALAASTGDADTPLIDLLARTEQPALACDAAQVLGRRRSERALASLAARVLDSDDNVAIAAIEALGRIGGPVSVEPLIAAMNTGNFFRVFPAMDVLGRTGDPRAVGALVALLDEPLYRQEAARALGRTGDPAALPPLVNLLSRSGDTLLRVAASALVELHDRALAAEEPGAQGSDPEWGRALAEVVPSSLTPLRSRPSIARRLAQCLTGADAAGQAALCRVLAWIGGEPAIAVLVELLDAEPLAAQAAAQALRDMGPEAEPLLGAELRDSGSARRARILPLIGPGAVLVAEVLSALDDPETRVRALACDALGRVGDPSAVPALFGRLDDEDPYVIHAATGAIQALGGPEAEALALTAARSPSWMVRRAALQVLGHLGSTAGLDILLDATSDPDDRIREAAVQGLPQSHDPRAVAELLTLTRHAASRTRAAAMRALGRIQREPSTVEALGRGVADADPWVRYYACQSLGRLQEQGAAEILATLVHDEAGQVRLAAVEALSKLDTPRARDALLAASRAEDPELQRAAVLGLGATRRPEALPTLLEASRSEDPTTRLIALSALPEFQAPEVDQAITRLTGDPDPDVRRLAERTQRR